MEVTWEQARWFRLRRHGLVEPFPTAAAAASALVGVQAQIPSAAGLALRNRAHGLTSASLDRALYDERTLLRIWAQRGTLHLFQSDDWPLIHAAHASGPSQWERWFARRGHDVALYHAQIERVAVLLSERGYLSRSDLRASGLELAPWLLSSWGGAFAELVRRGLACHARPDGEGRFAHRSVWLPELDWDPPSAGAANAELARRYLRAYGPATPQDLAFWRGKLVADAREWLAPLGETVAPVRVGGSPMLALREDLPLLAEPPPEREAWPVRLLYRFDPLLLAHRRKEWVVDSDRSSLVWRPAGHVEGVVLEHCRAAGTWRYDRAGRGLKVTVLPFAPLPAHVAAALEHESAAAARFFDLPLTDLSVLSG